jgi:hypothetical protein
VASPAFVVVVGHPSGTWWGGTSQSLQWSVSVRIICGLYPALRRVTFQTCRNPCTVYKTEIFLEKMCHMLSNPLFKNESRLIQSTVCLCVPHNYFWIVW